MIDRPSPSPSAAQGWVLRLTAVGLVAFLGVFAAACGGKVIDHIKAEEFINQDLSGAGVTVESVSCPSGVDVESGVDFECEVTADGGDRAVVQMRIIDDEGRVKPIKIESASNVTEGGGSEE